MTNKGLLEFSAKAAGIKLNFYHDEVPRDVTDFHPTMNIFSAKVWNPLTDDGDALRLAVNLGLVLELNVSEGAVHAYQHTTKSCTELVGNDALKATRRAITRAAAEIGKTLG